MVTTTGDDDWYDPADLIASERLNLVFLQAKGYTYGFCTSTIELIRRGDAFRSVLVVTCKHLRRGPRRNTMRPSPIEFFSTNRSITEIHLLFYVLIFIFRSSWRLPSSPRVPSIFAVLR